MPQTARIGLRSIRQHGANVSFGDGYAVHLGVAVKPPHRLAPTDAAHVVFDGIAGHHRFSEFALVDGQKIDRTRFLGAFDRLDANHARRLRHSLDHHHPWVYRAVRKMTQKWRLVDSNVLDPD